MHAGIAIDVRMTPEERRALLLADARAGLTGVPRSLSPMWLYDERGSALFSAITALPEYYLTRAEVALLEDHGAEIAAAARADALVELGSGTSAKTRLLLDAMRAEGSLARYAPLDVSEETLRAAAERLSAAYPGLAVRAVVGDFRRHLDAIPDRGRRRLVAFLGSTIGNLDPRQRARFYRGLRAALTGADRFLLGVDLIKDRRRLVAAYDDSQGVTAAFNRNALRVLNRELGGDLDPECFDHVARWDEERGWIELRLRARVRQATRLAALDLAIAFEPGDELRTEICAKFTVAGLRDELGRAGLVIERSWQRARDYLLALVRIA